MPIGRRHTLLPIWLLCMTSSFTWAAGPPAGVGAGRLQNPEAVVESLHGVLIECMKGDCGPDIDGRYQRIVAQLDETFDLAFMARVAVGKTWRTLSPEEQALYYDLSRRLSAFNYASNFNSYAGQHFATLGEEPAARGTILVKTEFVQPSDDNVRFDYRLRQVEGRWRIIDITLDGKVSEITLRRADYGAVIERKGFEKLISSIRQKIAKLEDE
jgi:phospholipid transport system substrate-binding protein